MRSASPFGIPTLALKPKGKSCRRVGVWSNKALRTASPEDCLEERHERAAKRLHIYTPHSCIFRVTCVIPSRATCFALSRRLFTRAFAQLTCGRARPKIDGWDLALPPNPSKASSVPTPIYHRLPQTTNYPTYHPTTLHQFLSQNGQLIAENTAHSSLALPRFFFVYLAFPALRQGRRATQPPPAE